MSDADRLHAIFRQYDVDNSGTISKEEISLILKALHLPDSESDVKAIMKQMDSNRDGIIDFEEFQRHCHRKEREIQAIFESIDSDRNGYVTSNVSKRNMSD